MVRLVKAGTKLRLAAIILARSDLQTGFVLMQALREASDAFVKIDLGTPAQFSSRKRDIQRIAVAMGADFCGARVVADLEGEVRQRFLN